MAAGPALFTEITVMGIDPAALLSRRRVEEIGAAIQADDIGGAREVVRNLAPAAVRRLSRRLIADGEFRDRTQEYVRRFSSALDDARRRDHQGFEGASLLSTDQGRAFLLLDAAGP